MARVTTINVFETDRICIAWNEQLHSYEVRFENGTNDVAFNVWRGHGKERMPDLFIEGVHVNNDTPTPVMEDITE